MAEKMTFNLTEEEARIIRNALAIASDIYKDEKKASEAERLHELFRCKLIDRQEVRK